MALSMRGFILGAPKPNSIQLPSCKSYQQKAMTMLQTQHHGLKSSLKISRSLITCANKKPGTGSGPKINQTTSSEQLSVSNGSSPSNSERTGKKSKGSDSEANVTPKAAN
ncbi:PREDICTED: uncharacterized protein LOC101310586 [Fragaria vesca subsp. vesca]|uniref:uncharacterized protein LOC101310586 n=1 Tax=Fragaria vesca subsp. vesca TaxID=101020 RepID=UPI0002C34EB2|nr:PREDICTED: uncharacterized protein LOC101310586 [Fragaria vesca subsp. vesca]